MKPRLRAEKKANAGAAKAEFVEFVSHRLREPLAPLLFAVEVLLREESLSPQGVEMIEILHRNAKEEARAINEVLSVIQQT